MSANRYAAQAVTVDGYGDPEIVVQEMGDGFGGWATGPEVAHVPIDGDFTSTAGLDHALTGAGFERVTEWEPCSFGSVATVERMSLDRGVPIAAALSPGTYISELRDAEDAAEAARSCPGDPGSG